ncbi:DUF4173 domain-containing protein [Psychroserpens sp. SPM9]|uniref:DUF4153 domain-containing protein n=1 Tax=Psychroserpens sp. SPM9 TaxID=2975598 RepID=UPI0021A9475A|nr:DUF4173 domain-containing protein [Psychroserpens sp. SPM9]MDG5492667.1 DUF4173 domain-containing protein [Psychroserpens sp. SPM9]
MKPLFTIIASILFSMLFYGKHIGLNLSIFSVLAILFLGLYQPKKIKDKRIVLHALAYLLTAVVVFIQHSSLAIIANCVAFFTLVGAISNSNTSIYVHWLNGLYTSIAGFFYRTFEVDSEAEKVNWKKDIDVVHWIKLIAIPLVFIIIFILLYKNGNPMFSDLVNMINFDFINFQWVLFTVLGYFLFSNISKPLTVEPATSTDLKINNDLSKSDSFSEDTLKKEKQLGTVLLGLLNLLILFYIITDITYLVTTETSSASALSNQVHSGINTLIASILIAIVIILYFFRGDLNFYSDNKTLKNLTFLWIGLNVLLIILIAIKNQTYITSFGLTYKRIGVHVYIFLTLVGLVTTFLKVMNIKNMVFLFRRNTQIAFIVLLLCSTINWDRIITKYNLNHAAAFDMDYLIKLSDRNAILLYQKKDDIAISDENKNRIDTKYRAYINKLNIRAWQEYSYENFNVELDPKTSD